jgi:hypothetical protein
MVRHQQKHGKNMLGPKKTGEIFLFFGIHSRKQTTETVENKLQFITEFSRDVRYIVIKLYV